jgi:hypothetical protein
MCEFYVRPTIIADWALSLSHGKKGVPVRFVHTTPLWRGLLCLENEIINSKAEVKQINWLLFYVYSFN